MKCIFKLLFIVIIFSVFPYIFSKKKKKKEKNPNDLRPTSISKELFCDACQAIIQEAIKRLRGLKKESDVLNYLTKVCDPERYNIYHFPPPQMREGCEAFYGAYGDEVEKVLINRDDDVDLVKKFCYEETKVCEGVDFKNLNMFDDTITVDGEPMKMDEFNKKNKGDL